MCTKPKTVWLPNNQDDSGKRNLRFKPPILSKSLDFKMMQIPCNHCIECESLRSLKTAVQLYCELLTVQTDSLFLTLTYDDQHLPKDASVSKEHLRNFIKKLRHWLIKNGQTAQFRYLSQGEYGGLTNRAHYHLCAFNICLDDQILYSDRGTHSVFESEVLNEMWTFGSIKISALTFESCLYTAQHHFKEKINDKTKVHLQPIRHPVTNKLIRQRQSEFSTRSSRPGIGKTYFEKYHSDIFSGKELNDDCIIIDGQLKPVPAYFSKLLKQRDPALYDQIIENRLLNIKERTCAENEYAENFKIKNLQNNSCRSLLNIKNGRYYADKSELEIPHQKFQLLNSFFPKGK